MNPKERALRLHPDKGVNPRISCCKQCGKDVGVIMLGAHDYMTRCPACEITLIGLRKCPQCNSRGVDEAPIEEHIKLPVELCDDCDKMNAEHRAIVEAGGVGWRCSDCGSEGVIRAESELAKEVRKKLKVEPPKACGVEFNKEEGCPVCSVPLEPSDDPNASDS